MESAADDAISGKPRACGCCGGWLLATRDQDRRLATSYTAYAVGRWLSLLGSCLLLIGLLIKFMFLTRSGAVDILVLIMIVMAVGGVSLGAIMIIWSASRARHAQRQYQDERHLRYVTISGTVFTDSVVDC